VFQDARLLPWLTAAGNIRAVRPDLDDAGLARLLDQVGLAGHAASFPRQLSGGMQRRLGLARALSANSRLLLLDEPFVSLDRAAADEMQALFRQVFETHNPTVILVSHDPGDAARLADRVVLLHGRPVDLTADIRLPGGGATGPVEIARRVERILAAGAAR
jgi:NitT/TauT family transport system ATP-binding protein/sulfonate transport system ATP-binding protein